MNKTLFTDSSYDDGEMLHVWNVTEKLLCSRVIKIYDQITAKTAQEVTSLLDVLDNESHEPIKLEICTPGGDVLSGNAIVDKIKTISSPVIAYCTGLVASMGTVICAACDYAFATPNAWFMLHEVSNNGVSGKIRDTEADMKFSIRLNQQAMGILCMKCHKTYDELMSDIVRNYWMNASEAISYHLIDSVTPDTKKNTKGLSEFLKQCGIKSK